MKIDVNYFITTNEEALASFQAFKMWVPLPDKRVRPMTPR